MSGMPTVRIDDILVHPRDNDLVVGTHGRGIYILDDVSALQQLTRSNGLRQRCWKLTWHHLDERHAFGSLLRRFEKLSRFKSGTGTAISYYLKSAQQADVKLTVSDYTGKIVRTLAATKKPANRIQWNLKDPPARPVVVVASAAVSGGGGGGGELWWRRRWRRRWFGASTSACHWKPAHRQAHRQWKGLHMTRVVIENDPGM